MVAVATITLGVRAQEPPPRETTVESPTLDTPTGKLAGTLIRPSVARLVPVVLMIAGSGPTDRDGNTPLLPGRNNSLRLLAEGLANQGVASVRYDKRGVAASREAGPSEVDLRFETYVSDVVGWVRRLRADPRFCGVVIVGHSEGALIGTLAARQTDADALIAISGPARPAAEVLRGQLAGRLPPDLESSARRILAALEAGRTVDSVPPLLWALFRPSVQPYLISWFRYNPVTELRRVSVPVLLVQGTTDIQVRASDTAAFATGVPRAKRLVIPGMSHVLKMAGSDSAAQQRAYTDPTLPVPPLLVAEVARFARAVPACRTE